MQIPKYQILCWSNCSGPVRVISELSILFRSSNYRSDKTLPTVLKDKATLSDVLIADARDMVYPTTQYVVITPHLALRLDIN